MEVPYKQNYDQGAYPQAELRPGSWLAGWLRPREAQRGPERRSGDRTSLPCVWLEAPHKQTYHHGGPPKISLWNPRGIPRGLLHTRVPNRNPLQTQGLPTSRITTREAPPTSRITTRETELPPESPPSNRIRTRELAGWLAGGITTTEPVTRLAG